MNSNTTSPKPTSTKPAEFDPKAPLPEEVGSDHTLLAPLTETDVGDQYWIPTRRSWGRLANHLGTFTPPTPGDGLGYWRRPLAVAQFLGQDYIILRDGDTVIQGDEWYDPRVSASWVEAQCVGRTLSPGTCNILYRRKLAPTKPVYKEPSLTHRDTTGRTTTRHFNFLEVGDTLQPGDEHYFDEAGGFQPVPYIFWNQYKLSEADRLEIYRRPCGLISVPHSHYEEEPITIHTLHTGEPITTPRQRYLEKLISQVVGEKHRLLDVGESIHLDDEVFGYQGEIPTWHSASQFFLTFPISGVDLPIRRRSTYPAQDLSYDTNSVKQKQYNKKQPMTKPQADNYYLLVEGDEILEGDEVKGEVINGNPPPWRGWRKVGCAIGSHLLSCSEGLFRRKIAAPATPSGRTLVGYRFLAEGEVIDKGDEYQSVVGGQADKRSQSPWESVDNGRVYIGSELSIRNVGYYRRKVQAKSEYRPLNPGELVKKGDEVSYRYPDSSTGDPEWVPSINHHDCIGGAQSANCVYHRKIGTDVETVYVFLHVDEELQARDQRLVSIYGDTAAHWVEIPSRDLEEYGPIYVNKPLAFRRKVVEPPQDPVEYRLLKVGEIIEEGDEVMKAYLSSGIGKAEWKKVGLSIGTPLQPDCIGTFRRKVVEDNPSIYGTSQPPPPLFRDLASSEKVRADDEVYYPITEVWGRVGKLSNCVGLTAGSFPTVKYRRRISAMSVPNCPHCGGESCASSNLVGYYCTCAVCHASGPIMHTEVDAIAAWALTAKIDALFQETKRQDEALINHELSWMYLVFGGCETDGVGKMALMVAEKIQHLEVALKLAEDALQGWDHLYLHDLGGSEDSPYVGLSNNALAAIESLKGSK